MKIGFLPLYIALYDKTGPKQRIRHNAFCEDLMKKFEGHGLEVVASEIITIDKNVTIDMNNKKITNGAFKLADGVTVTVENYSGTEAELEQIMSGKLTVANPYGVPSTADNSNMPLWTILFVGFAAVALLTGKKRRA